MGFHSPVVEKPGSLLVEIPPASIRVAISGNLELGGLEEARGFPNCSAFEHANRLLHGPWANPTASAATWRRV